MRKSINQTEPMSIRTQHIQTTHNRRRVRVRGARVARVTRSDYTRDSRNVAHQVKVLEAAAARHQHRAAIYASSYDKLNIKPNAPLETQWGNLPSELVEVVAGYMEPRDVIRLRNVSSGWRAAL